MKCARPLQSLSQILLRGDTVSKPLILLPTPNSSASLTSVSVLLIIMIKQPFCGEYNLMKKPLVLWFLLLDVHA